MRYYPLFANLSGQECLVVGAGQVGRRKIAALLDAGPARVLVVDVNPPSEDMAELVARDDLDYETREFRDEDVEGKFLVIACTDSEDLNWRISNLCRERRTLCNIVDQPEKCSFIVPAVYSQGDLTMAVSTGGASPALAKKIRRELGDVFGAHYGRFLAFMGDLRPTVLGLGRPTDENTELFRRLVESGLMEAMREGDQARAETIVRETLPAELVDPAVELLHEHN
jgi:precorrin-2 dehydrogenase/sirohydrochlorin ferrochelatase